MSIQVPVTQTGLEASIQAAAQRAGRNLKIDLGVSSRSIGALSQPLGKITGQADQFTKSMEAANARVLAFGASVGVLSAVAAGFNSIITTTIQVEKSLADINSVLGASAAQLNKFKNDIFSVAKETGSSFQTVSEAALELSRQGLGADEVLRRLKDSMILARLSGLDAASSVEGLTAAVNSFSKEGITTSDVLNKISKTAAAFSVSERDLIEGFKRSASVAQQAGVSLDELGGIITAVQQKTARGGAVIGNAFKTIFTRIQRPDSLAALQDIGAEVTDAQGKILPATKLIENLAQKINGLNDIQVASITEKIGGGFQVGPLIAALDDITGKTSTFKKATEAMAGAGSEAYQRNAALNVTLAASINMATVNLQELANTLGEIGVTDSLKNLLSYFNSFATDVKNVLQGEGIGSDFAKGIVKAIGDILSGPGLLLFGAIIAKLAINFVQFGAVALKTFFNIGSAAREIGAIQTNIASTLLNNKSIQTQILALEGNRVAQAQFFSTALNTQLATMERMRGIAASIAPAVYGATTGAGRPRAAGGYMPTVMAEANDINKGVGGARSSDRPVIIPNFAFGGGRTGTMVANTGEHIVKNYGGGGGSAIFNRNMAKGGLPSGAQQIRGAGGFIPNFVSSIQDAKTQSEFESLYNQPRYAKNAAKDAITYGGTARGIAAAKAASKKEDIALKKQSTILSLDGSRLGLVSVSGATAGTADAQATGFVGNERISLDKNFKDGSSYQTVILKGIQTRSLKNLDTKLNDNQKAFRQKVANKLVNPILELSQELMPGVFSGNDLADKSAEIKKVGTSDPYVFSDSVLGGIFESAVYLATSSVAKMKSFNDTEQNKPFDFEEAGGASAAFKSAFGFDKGSNIFKAEAKKTQRGDTLNSIVGKALRDKPVVDMLKAGAIGRSAASGYIPNFADPLKDAISREVGAGLNPSQIYVDQSNSLKGPMNPSGLMVANRRDEPSGGFQGIARARKEGANAKMYGAANGFIPNFAPQIGQIPEIAGAVASSSGIGFGSDVEKAINEFGKKAIAAGSNMDELAKQLKDTLKALSNNEEGSQRLADESRKQAEAIKKARTTPSLPPLEMNAQKTAASGAARPLAKLKVEEVDTEKSKKDFLGTIFAIQAGLSVLNGATSDVTEGFGKIANSLGSVASTASSVLFAGQGLAGLAKEGSAASKVLGKVGVVGAVAAGAFEAYRQVGSYLDSTNLSIGKASKAMDGVAKAAENASINLSKFRPAEVKEIQKQRDALISGATRQGVTAMKTPSTSGTYGGPGAGGASYEVPAIASFEGYTDVMKKEFEGTVDIALAAGVSYGKVFKLVNEAAISGATVTADEVAKISKEIKLLTELAAKFKPKDIIKDLKLSPEEGLGQRIATFDSEEFKSFADPKNKSPDIQKIRDSLTEKGIAEGVGQTKALELIRDELIVLLNAKTEESQSAAEGLNVEYNKLLASLKGQAEYTKIINELENKSLTSNKDLLDIAKNVNLTDIKRADAIEDSNKEFEKQNNLIQNQKTAYQGLESSLEKTLSGPGLKIEDFDKTFASITKNVDSFSGSLTEAFAADDFQAIEEISREIGASLGGLVGQQGLANAGILEYIKNLFTGEQKINDQASLLKISLGITRTIAEVEKDRNDNLAKRNELLQNSIQLDQQLKDLQIKELTPEEFAKRKQVVELGRPKLNETSLDALKREAQKAQTERDLQPTDQSRAVQDIQQRSLRDAIQQATSLATKGKDATTQVPVITKKIAEVKDLKELRGEYGNEFDQNLDKIIEKRNTEISQLKETNDLQKEGLSLAEQKLQAIQSGVFGGLDSGFTKLREENEMFAFNLGERIPSLFADNMAAAMESVIMQGESLGDALRVSATSFLNEINKANIKNLAGMATEGFGTLFRASGGPITGGSGSKDDVPAMLMGGEYVMNKKAVSKYGSGFMEALNNGSISGFADGGSVIRSRGLASDTIDSLNIGNQTGEGGFQMPGYYGAGTISGKENLLRYATQSYTSGAEDIIGGGSSSSYIDLGPESVRLTNFGRNQGPMAAAVKESKGQAFDLYMQQLAAEKQAKEEEKAQKEAFKMAIISALITSAVSVVGGAVSSGVKAGMGAAGEGAGFSERFVAGAKGAFFGGDIGGGVMGGGLKNLFTGNFALSQISDLKGYEEYLSKNPKEIEKFLGGASSRTITGPDGGALNEFNRNSLDLDGMQLPIGGPIEETMLQERGSIDNLKIDDFKNQKFIAKATGGRIPQTSGIDTVPAMLSGGEFIMNAGATQRIGANNLNAMNSGASTETNSSTINDQLINKIDELIRVTKESSKPVTVNVSSQQGQNGGDKEKDDGTQKDQNLSKRIRDAVVKVLQEEKRLGGVLRRN